MHRLVLIASLLALAATPDASAGSGEPATVAGLRTLTVQGRSIDVYVPRKRDKRAPLMLAFHWSTARSKHMLRLWQATADREGIILVLPTSRHRLHWTKEDAAAVDTALARVLAEESVDRSRIYTTGFSGGANFAYRYFLTHPKLFAGLGPFAGRLITKPGELDRLGRLDRLGSSGNQRACIVHGTSDRKIPFSEARRAVRELGQHGLQVEMTPLQQGHWPHPLYATPMWKCLDGDRDLDRT